MLRGFLTAVAAVALIFIVSQHDLHAGDGGHVLIQAINPKKTPYNGGIIAITDLVHKISGEGNSGYYFNYKLNPKKKYSLKVSGSGVQGKTTLRIGKAGEKTYTSADVNDRQWTIHGVDELEVLFYSDQPFEYDLKSLEVRSCPECRTDEDLKNRILHEIPELDGLLEEDRYAAAARLLDWAANEYVFAISPEIPAKTNPGINGRSAAELFFNVFEPRRGGGYCGAAAVFLSKILKLFDFDAFALNFGDLADDLTHVTVVLSLNGKFYLLDPTFNMQMLDEGGRPLPLETVDWSNFSTARFHEKGIPRRVFLATPNEASQCQVQLSESEGNLICNIPDFSTRRYLEIWQDRLKRNGIEPTPNGFWSLMSRRVMGIGNCTESYCARFLNEIRSRKIPIGIPVTNGH